MWRSLLSSTSVKVRVSPGEESFEGSIRSRAFQGVVISRIRAGAHRAERTAAMIEAGESKGYMLCIQLVGTSRCTQGGRTAQLGPGDVSMIESDRPYDLHFDPGVECLGILIPERAIALPALSLRRLAATRVQRDEPLAALVAAFVDNLESRCQLLDESVQQRLIGNAVDLIETLWADQLRRLEQETDFPTSIPSAVMRYIELNLPDPELSPASIATANYMSVRKLHGLFAREEISVSAWIRERRLERCRDDLARRDLVDVPISRIAARWGFTSQPHFSLLFRKAYGTTASDYRTAMAEQTG
ncbi:MAG: helix-turn-helix domain-containing protein [Nocardioides sp.]